MTKKLLLLGSTGSVGRQSADVARAGGYAISGISAHKNLSLAEDQIREFSPAFAVMTDEAAARDLKVKVADTNTIVLSGKQGLKEMIATADYDVAVNAIIGSAGLTPTLDVIERGAALALSNKESLVTAGDLVIKKAKERNVRLTPCDSEHSAIYQCLRAGEHSEISRLIVTASGGPFFGKKRSELESVTREKALAHPTWSMGASITIDSATLMNKGFEVIEASKLFGVPADMIDVLIQRESIIHSLVEFRDGAQIAQLSVPDMRLCVQYAIEAPVRREACIPRLDLAAIGSLSFARPDTDTFIPLKLAYEALRAGGAAPAVLHAANEVAVEAFLNRKLSFTGIFDLLEYVTEKSPDAASVDPFSLEDILSEAGRAAVLAAGFIGI